MTGIPVRADLLALDADALAALANRGLVKRAAREVENDPPTLTLSADGTVEAGFADGVRTELPVGGLGRGTCSCGARGICRHVIGLVLAYRRAGPRPTDTAQADTAQPDVAGSGGALPDVAGSGVALPGVGGSGVALPGVAGSGAALPDAARPDVVGFGAAATSGVQSDVAELDLAGPVAAPAGVAGRDAAGSGTAQAAGLRTAEPGAAGSVVVGPGDAGTATRASPGGVSSGAPANRSTAGTDSAGLGEVPGWSPGEFGDAELSARIGARLMTVARRVERAGYTARVRRGTVADPVPVVELGSATVRFLVPRDLGYAHTDVAGAGRDEVIALAVWAFRVADERFPDRVDCRVEVGGTSAGTGGSGLEAVVELAGEVLRGGAAHGGSGPAQAVAVQARRLERDGLQWPLRALDELGAQLVAYQDRSARYAPEALAGLIAELFARHRAVVAGGSSLRSRVLGTQEAAETPLRRVRLDGLGARVSAAGGERRVEIFHAHAAMGVVLVSRRDWTTDDDGPALGRRRMAGSTVGGLAAGSVITESAVRSASRAVRLTGNRVAQATVTPSSGAWDGLPASLLVRDFGELGEELDALPPRPVRARVEAELVRVLAIAEVTGMRYEAGRQRLRVRIRDAAGTTATVAVDHAAVAPGRLDAVAAAFSGARGRPRFVTGTVHRSGRGVVVEPLAIAADGVPIVPDLAGADPEVVLGADGGAAEEPDPLGEAVAWTREALTDAAHSGLAYLPAGYTERLAAAADGLARVGLLRVAASVRRLAVLVGPDPGEEAIEAWVDAFLRVSTAAESL